MFDEISFIWQLYVALILIANKKESELFFCSDPHFSDTLLILCD